MGKKEKVDTHPILSIHKKRCNCIRAELSKGTITRQFATATKEIADELKTFAIYGDNYTAEQFKKDMTREACVLGILRALEEYPKDCDTPFITYKTRIMWEEIHNYIRTMRTGFTVQSDDEYRNLRNIMLLYTTYNSKGDPDTLKISDEVGLSEKTVKEILRSGFHNMQFVDFYRSYADEDSEESHEDATCDYTFEPCRELKRAEQTKAVFGALDELSYREREVIHSYIGFCPDCHSMKSPEFRPHTFQEIAYKNELSSAEAAENIYHKGLAKMKDKLQKKGIFHS